jgi:hypothetical protein
MAERTILVCDACGKPAVQTVGLRVAGRSLQKDVCKEHLEDVLKGARPARRGRRKGSTVAAGAAPPRRGGRRAGKAKAKAAPKRRGRPRKKPATEQPAG